MKEKGKGDNVVFDIIATILFSKLRFNDDPSKQEFDTLNSEIILIITLTTGLNITFKQTNLKKANNKFPINNLFATKIWWAK